LYALNVSVKASKKEIQISGTVRVVPETDGNFVTTEQTPASVRLALPRLSLQRGFGKLAEDPWPGGGIPTALLPVHHDPVPVEHDLGRLLNYP